MKVFNFRRNLQSAVKQDSNACPDKQNVTDSTKLNFFGTLSSILLQCSDTVASVLPKECAGTKYDIEDPPTEFAVTGHGPEHAPQKCAVIGQDTEYMSCGQFVQIESGSREQADRNGSTDDSYIRVGDNEGLQKVQEVDETASPTGK